MAISIWRSFFFCAEKWFGLVDTEEKFREVLEVYPPEVVLRAHSISSDGTPVPRFGIFPEFEYHPTLEEWAKKVGMILHEIEV